MQTPPMMGGMSAEQAHAVDELLDWCQVLGVDALLGRVTREHKDLDLLTGGRRGSSWSLRLGAVGAPMAVARWVQRSGGDPIGDMCSCTIFHAPSSLTSTIVVCWSAEIGLPPRTPL